MTTTMSSVSLYNVHHCVTKPELKTFCYTWTIENFWTIYECYTELCSSTTDYCRFYLTIAKDDLKFYIKDISNKKFTASYSVCLKNNEKDIMLASKSLHEISDNKLLCELSISRDSRFLSNGAFVIDFKFDILVDLHNYYVNHSLPITPKTLPSQSEKTNNIPNEKSDSLVTFVIKNCDKECLQANKDLLCLHSTVFEKMFQSGFKESKDKVVPINDTSYNILKELLYFLQNGYLSQNIQTDREALCELFITAEKYDIKNLKLICQDYLIINTTIKNVVEHLKIADLHHGKILGNYATEFIKLHFEHIEATPEFKTLMQRCPELLTQIRNVDTKVGKCDTKGYIEYKANCDVYVKKRY